jgi:hypothetical protein
VLQDEEFRLPAALVGAHSLGFFVAHHGHDLESRDVFEAAGAGRGAFMDILAVAGKDEWPDR